MQMYNFFQVHSQLSDQMKGGKGHSIRSKKGEHSSVNEVEEQSLCITEENRFQNEINPIKLADLGWGDDYKLDKLMRQQIKMVEDGNFDPDALFGGVDSFDLEEAFMWFDIASKDLELHLLKRKSSAGLVASATMGAHSVMDLGSQNFKLQTSGTMLGLGRNRNLSIILQGEADNTQVLGSSQSSSDDEAEKFKNTFLKNSSKYLLFQSRQESNLLVKNKEEEEFDQKTPRVLSSRGSSEEEEKEDRPLQRLNFQGLEELVEESREESMRGDSNVQSHKKIYIDGRSNKKVVGPEEIENLDEVRKGSIVEREVQPTNRLYDSDIFVMSNTTFDEELASLSSRRVSAGKQPYKNMSFVENSRDQTKRNSHVNNPDHQQIKGITSKLFFQQ